MPTQEQLQSYNNAIAYAQNTMTDLYNISSAANASRKGRRWAENMYKMQRADALKDWEMVNEYNSPTSQMARLKAGGLNPNLIYGSGANNISQPVRSSSNPGAPTIVPKLEGQSMPQIMSQFADIDIKKQTVDNLREQNRLIAQQAAQAAASTNKIIQDTKKSSIDTTFAESNLENSLEYAKLKTRGQEIANYFQMDENERRTIQTSINASTAVERILSMRIGRAKTEQEIKNLKAGLEYIKQGTNAKRLDNEMRQLGINPQDPTYVRILGRVLNYLTGDKTVAEGDALQKVISAPLPGGLWEW